MTKAEIKKISKNYERSSPNSTVSQSWRAGANWMAIQIKSCTKQKGEGIKKLILDEYKKGNVVINDHEGLKIMPLDEIIKQPVDRLLYDLNRNEAVILTFLDDPKWINDYACAQVIRKLKDDKESYTKQQFAEFMYATHTATHAKKIIGLYDEWRNKK